MEEIEERHQVEIKVYKQKVKHLLYEHQNSISQLKTEGDQSIHQHQKDFRTREQDLVKDKRHVHSLSFLSPCHSLYVHSLFLRKCSGFEFRD